MDIVFSALLAFILRDQPISNFFFPSLAISAGHHATGCAHRA